MNIVVVGDGKIGSTLTEQLVREGHDVTVIDKHQRIVDAAVNSLDVMGICGNGASYSVQQSAGVASADLVIASTDSDEVNMLCCLVAKKLGAQHTIARVRNSEYADQLQIMREDLGLSMFINPEFATASELFQVLRFPSALKIDTFANRKAEIVEIKLDEASPLDGLHLYDLNRKFNVRVLICAVQREGEVHIPGGDFILKSGDKISITAAPAQIERLFRQLGILKKQAHSVMIVGGSRIAAYLARMLAGLNVQVKIVDRNPERCEELCQIAPKALVINGDGTDQELLQEEGLSTQDAFVALTGIDEENIILSLYAKSKSVSKVITKVNSPALSSLVENVGLDVVISPREVSTNIILRYVRGMQNSLGSNIETLYKMVGGKVEALEFRVDASFKHLNVPLKDLTLKPNLLVACIARGKATILPGGNDEIHIDDRVIIVTTNRQLSDLSDITAN